MKSGNHRTRSAVSVVCGSAALSGGVTGDWVGVGLAPGSVGVMVDKLGKKSVQNSVPKRVRETRLIVVLAAFDDLELGAVCFVRGMRSSSRLVRR